VCVVGPRQQRGQLDPLQLLLETIQARLELARQLGIGLVLEELVGRLEIAERALEPIVPVDLVLQSSESSGERLPAGRFVPDRRVRCLSLDLDEPGALAVDVKGTPSRTARAPGACGDVRCGRS
jgi:hypothetical protein